MSFQRAVNEALDPTLDMYLFRENAAVAIYAGLWSTWRVNDERTCARIVLATVVKNDGTASPSGPVPIDKFEWIILQLQQVDEDSEHWTQLRGILDKEFVRLMPDKTGPTCTRQGLQYDPSTANLRGHQMNDGPWLSKVEIVQQADEDERSNDDRPGPISVINRRRVGYNLTEFESVRLFVEQPTTKQVLQQKLNGSFGLSRESNLLAAMNEWRTWLVVYV